MLATETGATWLPRNSVQPEQERRPRPAPAARQEEEAMQGPEKESSKRALGGLLTRATTSSALRGSIYSSHVIHDGGKITCPGSVGFRPGPLGPRQPLEHDPLFSTKAGHLQAQPQLVLYPGCSWEGLSRPVPPGLRPVLVLLLLTVCLGSPTCSPHNLTADLTPYDPVFCLSFPLVRKEIGVCPSYQPNNG